MEKIGVKIEILNIMEKNESSFYVIIESDLLKDKRISNTTKIVYAFISNYSNNKHGYCYLSYRQLMEVVGLSKPQFIRCINKLMEFNYITKIKKTNRTYLQPVINKAISMRKHSSNKNIEIFDYDWLNEN